MFFQAATAELLLSSSHDEALHNGGARVTYDASMLYVLAPRLIPHASASVQVALGIAHMPSPQFRPSS